MFSFELHWLAGGGSAKPSTPHAENVVGMIFDDEILAQSGRFFSILPGYQKNHTLLKQLMFLFFPGDLVASECGETR